MAEKLPSGKYRYKLYIGMKDGKRQYKSFVAESAYKAQEAAEEWKVRHLPSDDDPSLLQASEAFLAARTDILSPSTYRDYRNRIEYLKQFAPDLWKKRLSAIRALDIQTLVNRLATKPSERDRTKPISPKTVAEYYGVVETILSSYGIRFDVKLPQRKPPELNIPEDATIRQLLSVIKGTNLEIPVLLAALGPMRRGEICALTMDDIDFEKHIVHVRKSMVEDENKQWVIKFPKSTAGFRDIEYPQYVTDLIKEKGFIVKANPDTVSSHLRRVLQRHGIKHFRFHDLRHYAASFLLALDIPTVYVMERGGWQSQQSMRRYVHALEKQKAEFASKANAEFEKLFMG